MIPHHFLSPVLTSTVNINGVYFTTVGFLPLLRGSNDPSVIVISSLAGLLNQRAMGSVSYAVSKVSTSTIVQFM